MRADYGWEYIDGAGRSAAKISKQLYPWHFELINSKPLFCRRFINNCVRVGSFSNEFPAPHTWSLTRDRLSPCRRRPCGGVVFAPRTLAPPYRLGLERWPMVARHGGVVRHIGRDIWCAELRVGIPTVRVASVPEKKIATSFFDLPLREPPKSTPTTTATTS